ncbi:hypothetical protein EV383_5994 [Pseudonocardia sediminis]|uniref:Uncharacterized protein n=1 Tax=Pseudonocardia sediminis TaxID=1397368 RepID=A0A4V2FRL2_PSEST|nr:hypothetical protein [Pseudonocardia sediminis]RZT89040.1 hypothetical protein EV383_5994 [Pseudonocardia sediminis]
MQWRVGVLRSGVENIAWTDRGEEQDWPSARVAALASLRALVLEEGRQEYWLQVGDVDAIVHPGVDIEGRLNLSNVEGALPLER